jgi:hypothetical protein
LRFTSRAVQGVNVIERAFQLAPRSGSVEEVKRALIREGYFHVERHLGGRRIRADLVERLNPALVAQRKAQSAA